VAAPQLGRAQLEEKDRDDLAQIASALGIKGIAKADKSSLIERILEETMAPEPKEPTAKSTTRETSSRGASRETSSRSSSAESNQKPLGAGGEPLSEW